jgi:hypothetical protein
MMHKKHGDLLPMARKGAKGSGRSRRPIKDEKGKDNLAAFFFPEQQSMMKAEVTEIVGDPMMVGRVDKSLRTLSFAIKVPQKGLCACSIVVSENRVFLFQCDRELGSNRSPSLSLWTIFFFFFVEYINKIIK